MSVVTDEKTPKSNPAYSALGARFSRRYLFFILYYIGIAAKKSYICKLKQQISRTF